MAKKRKKVAKKGQKRVAKTPETEPLVKTEKPKKRKKGPTKLSFSVEVDAASAVYQLLEKCGSTKILIMLQQACSIESASKIGTVRSLFAGKEDVENIENMILLTYILNKKKELLPEAEKHWAERMAIAQKLARTKAKARGW